MPEDDALVSYALRCSILHGYGPPKASAYPDMKGRRLLLTRDAAAPAINTDHPGLVWVSVPAFCGRLVERIAFEARDRWDGTLVDTNWADGT